jgi:hypothetical protein
MAPGKQTDWGTGSVKLTAARERAGQVSRELLNSVQRGPIPGRLSRDAALPAALGKKRHVAPDFAFQNPQRFNGTSAGKVARL